MVDICLFVFSFAFALATTYISLLSSNSLIISLVPDFCLGSLVHNPSPIATVFVNFLTRDKTATALDLYLCLVNHWIYYASSGLIDLRGFVMMTIEVALESCKKHAE